MSDDKKVYVYLDTSENPRVQVDPKVLGRKNMKWRRENGSESFKFVSISFIPPGPFDIKTVTDVRINVKNDGTAGEYEYIITVEDSSGTQHTTTELNPPPNTGDKPVIRN